METKYGRRWFLHNAPMLLGTTELSMVGFGNAQFLNQKHTVVLNSEN